MGVVTKAAATAVLVVGLAAIGSFAADMARAKDVAVPGAAPGVIVARQAMPSVAGLEIRSPDGRISHAAAFAYKDGYWLTAAHAVAGDSRIVAVLADGRRLPLRVAARDDLSDVALVRPDKDPGLPPARFAAALPEVGAKVSAIGSPLGYHRSFTSGVLSAANRAYGDAVPYDFLQHDAALNPGNSGGPLLNDTGEVIGMNVAIADGSRHNIGIGLAVPADVVVRIAETLMREGRIARPVLGLRLRPAHALVEGETGAVIEHVEPQSVAARAGLKPGMVVVRAGTLAVTTPRDLAKALEPLASGQTLVIQTGGARPETIAVALTAQRSGERSLTRGLSVKTFVSDPGLRLEAGTARIESVAPDSAAERAGLLAGDTILGVGLARTEPAATEAALAAAGSGPLPLLVAREGASRYIVLGAEGRLDSQAPFGANAESIESTLL